MVSSNCLLIFSVPSMMASKRGAADQVRQASDHPAGALVQVAVESAQGAWGVPVQPKCVFEGSDEPFPFGGPGKRTGGDQAETAGDLTPSDTGEQATTLDVDAGVDERRRDPFGEVFECVGDLRPGLGGE